VQKVQGMRNFFCTKGEVRAPSSSRPPPGLVKLAYFLKYLFIYFNYFFEKFEEWAKPFGRVDK
jgi:hypothetical protein